MNTISIAGKEICIEYIETLVVEGNEVSGSFDHGENKIEIGTKDVKSKEDLKGVLLHEIIHAILHNSGLWQHFDDATEELICANMQTFLNPLINFKPMKTSKRGRKKNGK